MRLQAKEGLCNGPRTYSCKLKYFKQASDVVRFYFLMYYSYGNGKMDLNQTRPRKRAISGSYINNQARDEEALNWGMTVSIEGERWIPEILRLLNCQYEVFR